MTEITPDHDFCRQIDCTYKEERYSVRDNGAVLRHSRKGERQRPTDSRWTFGKPNDTTGYMEVAAVRVHLVVATAFYGERSTKEYVVDHIDTNRRNNRPENLRWVTRLDNALMNPATRKKIEFVCGCSVEEFLANPEKFRGKFRDQNFKWMRTVTEKEAKACLENMKAWAKSDKRPSGGTLGSWIYNPAVQKHRVGEIPKGEEIMKAKPMNAAQRNWRIPSEFPCCPQQYTTEPLIAYSEKLETGSLFCRNGVYSSLVLKMSISDDRQAIYVISESTEGTNTIKPFALAKITYENGLFVHTSVNTFFTKEGAEKRYSLAQGLEWAGGESVDDYT